jgi:hypothetical protein
MRRPTSEDVLEEAVQLMMMNPPPSTVHSATSQHHFTVHPQTPILAPTQVVMPTHMLHHPHEGPHSHYSPSPHRVHMVQPQTPQQQPQYVPAVMMHPQDQMQQQQVQQMHGSPLFSQRIETGPRQVH